ncbi:MAG TPA: PAS domain-containing protein [Candidatus Cottocaccamicrobium excrementipullorum]|nr:PAS domain-containing protein [Candidatus Cottocaccamicrobium excrementipullorum]
MIYTGERAEESFIVGIGASAGGLEALQQFFSFMSPDSGLSFVVVQHLAPDYKSLMADILGKYTEMRVLQAEDGMKVEPNQVYLIPPKKNIILRQGKLFLSEYVQGLLNHPIDIFFTSLAEEMKERSIGVILSGTGSDGTNGVKVIKEKGGLTIVQDPGSAKFDGMPKSAISTGLADYILSPKDIAGEILHYVKYQVVIEPDKDGLLFTDEESLAHIYQAMKKARGIDFTHYKRSTVLRRIERRMVVTHSESLSEYAGFLENNPEEINVLVKEILIGVTNFFRDSSFFETLKTKALYPIIQGAKEDEAIRVWSAGCSTGEEAYSLAILFHEILEEFHLRRDIKIFATDIDVQAIEQAGRGVYSENIVDDVSAERLAKYFIKRNDQYVISKEIRKMIIFAPHNMLSDPPFGKLDLISCRNVMIYFQPVLQRSLFAIFHSALKNGGYLFLGKSETANEYSDVFKPACSVEKIYIHNSAGKMDNTVAPAFSIPSFQPSVPAVVNMQNMDNREYKLESIYTRFMEKYMPASLVLDESNEVLHFFGSYIDFVSIAPGKASFNLFHILNKDLSLAASTALSRCRAENKTVTYTGITVDTPSGRRQIDLSVHPIPMPEKNGGALTAMMFLDCEKRQQEEGEIQEKYDINTTAARRITDLEQELQESQNDLHRTIGELETVNEELQAANEELLTANEELQSSNEELQSVNEELYTVNTEFQQKVEELTTMTNDLSNFLSSTMIGILFVDGKLNIRKFTEYIGREFQLMDHDIGRSIQIFAHSFPDEKIVEDAQNVLKTLAPVDREVVATNGQYYTMRIAPYRTTENSIKGLVITIIDSLGADRQSTAK